MSESAAVAAVGSRLSFIATLYSLLGRFDLSAIQSIVGLLAKFDPSKLSDLIESVQAIFTATDLRGKVEASLKAFRAVALLTPNTVDDRLAALLADENFEAVLDAVLDAVERLRQDDAPLPVFNAGPSPAGDPGTILVIASVVFNLLRMLRVL